MSVPPGPSERLAQVKRSLALHREFLELVHAVTELANESTRLDAVLEEVIDLSCESCGWTLGRAFLVDAGPPGRVRPTGPWRVHGEGEPQARLSATLDALGVEGLETLLSATQPSVLSSETNARAALAREHGLELAVLVPILAGEQVVALLEFHGPAQVAGDAQRRDALSMVLGSVGSVVGRVAEREALLRTQLAREQAEERAEELRQLSESLERAQAQAELAEEQLRARVLELGRVVRARDSVLSVVSHDLRGPLNNIELAMNLVEHGGEAQRQLALRSVRRACARANTLIRDLLEVGRLAQGEPQLELRPVAVEPMIQATLEELQPTIRDRAVELELRLEGGLPRVQVDRVRVMQVLDNLLRNALKFGPRGGRVEVGARVRGSMVELSVRDEGPGLDEQARAHVFERFWQGEAGRVRGGGSGLGLAIAKAFVEAHGGRIDVDATPGQGACFYFTVPALAGSEPSEELPAGPGPAGS